MGLHKLSAGDGYLYLIRQVAASDDTHRGKPSLADYYSEKGESPGRWMGSGLEGLGAPAGRDASDPMVAELWSVPEGSEVTEDQMKALFGEGLHPNADRITERLTGFGLGQEGAIAAARLGRPFRVNSTDNEWMRRLREGYADFNTTLGRDRQASLEPEERARIRTAVGREMFTETYGRAPADERELTGFVARKSRAQTQAVAGYDLTFTPVKSVSALWAIAPHDIAEKIEAAHHQAVADALAFLEKHAAFSRTGTNGVAQVDTTGFIAAAFDHRDSRAGDPNLHTHVAISNKVRIIGADGVPRWLALDGQPLHKAAVAASELYNTRLEAHLMAALSVEFAETRTKTGKRPVREIDGIPVELIECWSSRRAAVQHRVGELAKDFQAEHHREPTAVEMLALSQQATLETRQAKHEPRSRGEQRQSWRTEAVEVLGSHRELTRLITDVTGRSASRRPVAITGEWVTEQAESVIKTVSHDRSTWTVNHVRAEAHRLLRNVGRQGDIEALDRIVTTALDECSIALSTHADTEMNEPVALRRRDGASVYTRHDSAVYTSAAIRAAERRILDTADLGGGRVADDTSIGLAMLQAHAQHGLQLNAGQEALVRGMATSEARLQLALAPAGTGKTTAMSVLAAAWTNSGGNVIGLAPTAAAAEILAEDAHITTDTMAKFVQLAGTEPDRSARRDPARKWFNAIGPDTLLIVDEAGMASTFDLDEMITHAKAKGAKVCLVADDQQLTSISAGGVITDLASRPETLTLSAVVRFRDPAQSAASLAIRDGDPAGIAYYIDHGRVHVGADQTAADMAYQGWADDIAAGHRSVLLAPTNDLVAQLNERARLDRLRTSPKPSATVTLSDGLTASAGDWIITRKNARGLRMRNGTWVKNGHRWVIKSAHRDGSVTAYRLGSDPKTGTIRLPADYVAANTTLGYASTIHAAQGLTAGTQKTKGTCHIVGTDHLTRQQLYVAATRAKDENHVYFSTSEADPHRILAPKATQQPTAVDILTAILRRDGRQVSAHTAAHAETDPFVRLHGLASMYADALATGAEHLAGPDAMARIDQAATAITSDITDAEAWPVLRRNLALLALDGHDPVEALQHAAAKPLGNAVDVAAVLDWRLPTPAGTSLGTVGPLRWLPAIPAVLREEPVWGQYLTARAQRVTECAAQIRDTAQQWTQATAPAWARRLIAQQPGLTAEIAVFRAAHDVDAADTRLTGPGQHANRSAAVQKLIHDNVDAAITREHNSTQRWRPLVATLDPHILSDPYWPRLATYLDDAAQDGADVSAMLATAMAAHGPLPDELPAAALWWRLSEVPTTAVTLDHDPTDVEHNQQTPKPVIREPVDIPALRHHRDQARQRVRALEHAILHQNAGPAEQAAVADITALTTRHQHQRPYQHAYVHAQADWVRAQLGAETHHRLLDQLTHQLDAAQTAGNTALVDLYSSSRDYLARHTPDIEAAVEHAQQHREAAYAELLDAAGGPEGIVTDRDIQQRRNVALTADAQALREARAEATTLDNQLFRAEAAAARAFATHPDKDYDMATELPSLQTEVEFLEAAGARSPNAGYEVPETALEPLDDDHRRVLIAIAGSLETVQSLHLEPEADKAGVLDALAQAAHRGNHQGERRVLAIPASDRAQHYAAQHRYADTITSPVEARDNLGDGRWKLPEATLIVIDDADHLQPEQLRWLTEHADQTRTKLLLVTHTEASATPTAQQRRQPPPSRELTDTLRSHLPWHQHLGKGETLTAAQAPPTAIDRARTHLETISTTASSAGTEHQAQARQLLQRVDQLTANYHYRATDHRAHDLDRTQQRSHGLEL
ncbi:MobF family relaxase [Mycolicibacterium farcinogenes]|uniref:Relaxase domain-containing protein n=1 Tax=Mycolicibacterium farcinogenes TaxID=1802 RepID=A0ACD1FR83_MYCFR|nr:MobF family relaxase [Mycolicibacterium farcinogenes]QZH69604.1 relaxase domain-containing protein [Mycolicibacterium farcinogenes]